MARLITIGDSISQGFMSLAAAKTKNSYSTVIAKSLGLTPGTNYLVPEWADGGIPLNLERMFRMLQKYYGDDIWGPFEWGSAAIRISTLMDKVEDYYERGPGSYKNPAGVPGWHNLSSFGFNVSDAWEVTPQVCKVVLKDDEVDNFVGIPDNSFYRSAYRVLNPDNSADKMNYSQLEWIKHYAENDSDGLENLVIWLGANNALGTILDMSIDLTDMSLNDYKLLNDHFAKLKYNLWKPDLFEYDYNTLLDKVIGILDTPEHNSKQPNWKIFLGTVPAVTIAPIAKGVGEPAKETDPFYVITHKDINYFEYYTYLVFHREGCISGEVPYLTRAQAFEIDSYISGYNQSIKKLAHEKNEQLGTDRFFVVDTNASLLKMAYKRNGGEPYFEFPEELLELTRKPDTRYYKAEHNRVIEGGIFSLDGVHPGEIGHGVIAHEFMKVMGNAGVNFDSGLNWAEIVTSDKLNTVPLESVNEIYQHDKLVKLIMRLLKIFGKR